MCVLQLSPVQAIGIALESHRLDVIAAIYSQTKDSSLLSYAMEGILDTGFSLSYRDQVLRFLFPLFPRPAAGDGSPHVHALTRLLVTLSDPSLTIPLLNSLVTSEQLLAFQFAFDLVEGGSQDFLETLRTELPEGDESTKPVYDKLRTILTGKESVKFYREFLKRNNQTDLLILKNTKVCYRHVLRLSYLTSIFRMLLNHDLPYTTLLSLFKTRSCTLEPPLTFSYATISNG